MSVWDMNIEVMGKNITLHTVVKGAPDGTYALRSKADTTSIIKGFIGPWGQLRSYASGFERPGVATQSEMWALIKASVSVNKNLDWLEESASLKWDIVDAFMLTFIGTNQYQLLKLERRVA